MKKILLFSLSSFLVMFLMSCNKAAQVIPTLTPTQILSQNAWEVGELYEIVNDGDTAHYLRGVVNTTGYNEDTLRFTFNENGTGTYRSEVGANYTMAWQFTDQTDIHVVLTPSGSGSPVTFNWGLVSITDSTIYETTAESGGTMVSAKLIPVP